MTRFSRTSPIVLLALTAAAFWILPSVQTAAPGSYGVYSALQAFAAFGLVALALGLTMLAGEFDLSLLATYGLSGILAVKLGHPDWWVGVLAAVAAGTLASGVQGLLVTRLRIDSMAVTLGGYLVLLGIGTAITNAQTIAYEDSAIGLRLDAPIADVLSWHSIVVLAAFAAVWATMRWTRIGRDLRAVGGARAAARTAGVRTGRVVVGTFVVAGALAALGGALQALSLATADPDPGLDPLIFAATAALLGGVSLAGGQGSALGIAAGALALALLQTMFGLLASPGWVTSLVTGGLLAVAAGLTAPRLRAWWREARLVR